MLRDELITLIGWRLGDRDDMAARAVSEMQYTQQYILEANSWLPWFLEADAVGLATEVGIRSVPLPVDFLREIEAARPYLILADGNYFLEKEEPNQALSYLPGSGQPQYYSMHATELRLYPLPDAVYSIGWRYYAKSAPIHTATTEVPWLQYAGDLVAAIVGHALATKHIRDDKAAAAFGQDAASAWQRLLAMNENQRETNLERAMGGHQ